MGATCTSRLVSLVAAALVVASCGRGGAGRETGADAVDPKLADGGADGDVEVGDAAPDGALPPSSIATVIRVEDSRRLSRPLFERLVADPDVVVRRRALLALGRMGRAEGLAPLRTGLTDEDAEARRMALFGLGQLEASAHPDAERVILSFLELDRPPGERRAAVAALGHVGTESSRSVLIEAVESPDSALRVEAARALGIHAMRQRPPEQVPFAAIVPRLGDGEASVRLAAAFALSRSAPPEPATAPAVIAALEKTMRRDGDAEVRIMAARALSRIGLARPGVAKTAVERDPDWRVRALAATALGAAERPAALAGAITKVWGQVRDDRGKLLGPDLHPLVALLGAAIDHPSRGHVPALRRLHREAGARIDSAESDRERLALGHLRCLAALAMDLAEGQPRLVKRCALEASGIERWQVEVLEARAWHGSTSATANRRLARMLRSDDVRVRIAAVEAIGSLPGPGRLPLIDKALGDRNPHVVAMAAHALFDAAPLFEIEEQPSQNLAVKVHNEDGGTELHTLHEPAVERPPVPVKRVAKALERVDADEAVETALNLLKAVGRIRIEEVADKVRPLAGHHNAAVRREARRALERLGLDPGPEMAPDPPNLVDADELERLASASPPEVTVETTAGTFAIALRPDLAPATVATFLSLVRSGFYDGVTFHRVVPGFVVQVGDPTGTGYGGPGYTVRCEVTEEPYVRGSVGMALAGPDTGGSQLFVTVAAQPHLERRYTLFGRVVRGMEVVESLQQWDQIVRARVSGEASEEDAPTG